MTKHKDRDSLHVETVTDDKQAGVDQLAYLTNVDQQGNMKQDMLPESEPAAAEPRLIHQADTEAALIDLRMDKISNQHLDQGEPFIQTSNNKKRMAKKRNKSIHQQ